MTVIEGVHLAAKLADAASKLPGAVERVKGYVEGIIERKDVDDVLAELDDLERNHVEQARIDRLAAGGSGATT